MLTERVDFLGLPFDPLTQAQVLDRLREVTAETPYRYVVTPNVDHVLQVDEAADAAELRAVYQGSWMSVCDSRVLRGLAQIHGIELPLVTGSDLTVAILSEAVSAGDRIAVVGGSTELLVDLERTYPSLCWLHHVPPMNLRTDREARRQAAAFIRDSRARFAFLAVGSLQQELIAAEVRTLGDATGAAFCIGASLDFITGRQRRAPQAMQKLGLEWAYRLATDPKRLWRRYLHRGPRIFALAARFRRESRAG